MLRAGFLRQRPALKHPYKKSQLYLAKLTYEWRCV